MSDLQAISWRLDAGAGLWLAPEDLTAVTEWMRENELTHASAQAPVVVEDGTITYGEDWSLPHVRVRDREIETVSVPLRTVPPQVEHASLDPDVLAELLALFEAHEWSAGFDGVCVDCSDSFVGPGGRLWCHRDGAMPWPCPPVEAAFVAAGLRAAPVSARMLGDCLSEEANAAAFGRLAPA